MTSRLAFCSGVAATALMGVTSCSKAPVVCVGMQCGPPYQLEVDFKAGTAAAVAEGVLKLCADHNSVVVRVGALEHESIGVTRVFVYTHVFGYNRRTAKLINCLRASEPTQDVGFPD